MDELIVFAVLIIGALLLVPIIILIKISSMSSDIKYLMRQMKDVDGKLMFLLNNPARKEESQVLKKVQEEVPPLRQESPPITVSPQQQVYPPNVPQPAIEPEKPKVEKIEQPIISEPVIAPQVDYNQSVVPSPERKEDEQAIPYYAAISKPAEEKVVMTQVNPEAKVKTPAAPKAKEAGKNLIEKILGENWLSRIGIITFVLGIGFFVKYAIDQEWINEIGRVGIGLLTGAIIIGIAHKLKEKYQVFSSLLVGGGIAVFYITITLAFREYEIFSQTVAFALLIAVTVFSVLLSLLYNRQELSVFSLIGGFLSPLMISTGSGNYVVLFSFLLILNTGMLIVSLKKDWKLTGVVAYVLSLMFFWGWLLSKFDTEYRGATVFASLFFIQFYLLAIIKHYREQHKMSIFQALLVLTNNLSILAACMFIFNNYEPDVRGLAIIIIAVVNALVMVFLFRQTKIDKNIIYLIIGVVMSLVTLAVPIQLEGYFITMFWAVEAVVLLWLWQRSNINVFRFGFLVISIFVLLSYLFDAGEGYQNSFELAIVVNHLCITGLVVLVSFVVSLFLLKKESKEKSFMIKNTKLFEVKDIILLFRFIILVLAFLVPYLELNSQLIRTDVDSVEAFRYLSMATYTVLFIAALAIVHRNKIGIGKFIFFSVFIVLYAFIYSTMAIELRSEIYQYEYYSSSYFLIHFLSLPAVAYIVYVLAQNMRNIVKKSFNAMCWLLVIVCVGVLSVELDHIVIWLFSTPETYDDLLYDVHTFGYPILWGIIAMVLMIWGLNKKEVILRKIALISFGLIIVKFYAYDVWRMSQGGRIASFVILGVILLVVSFMQQKIKVLVKKDEKEMDQEEISKE